MLNEEAKERLTKELCTYGNSTIDEDLQYAEDLIENSSDIDDLSRKIVKLRIYKGLKYREISKILGLEKAHVVPNRFKSTMRYLRKQLRIHNRPNDGTEQLSKILSNRTDLMHLSRNDIYTVGQFAKILEDEELPIKSSIVSSIIYTLELIGHKDLRSIVKNRQVLEDLEDLDRRNYRHIQGLELMYNAHKDVLSSEISKASYTHSSRSEFGTIKITLSNQQRVKIKVAIDFNFELYRFCIEMYRFGKSDEFDYLQTIERTFEAKFDELEKAVDAAIKCSLEMTN